MLIKETSTAELERELARAKRILAGNKDLLPQSLKFYQRRRDAIEAEIVARTAQTD